MEKLLHERLREWEDNGDGTYSVLIENADVRTTKSSLMALADEIERYYIPRPRFDDNEPVDFHERMGNGKHVRRIIFREDGWTVDSGNDGAKRYGSYNSGTCKTVPRYHEPVLDADGVEIKVGDKLWSTSYPFTIGKTVSRVGYSAMRDGHSRQQDAPFVDYAEGGWDYVRYLTHERPVFDADGVRIRKGDTVWETSTGDKHIVEELTEDGVIYIDRSFLTWSGDMFTHRELDSLEKLRDDIEMYAACEGGHIEESVEQFADRLTALIERGAK